MTDRYTVRYAGPDTSISSDPDSPWPRWYMARAAAIDHVEEIIAECRQTLRCLRRAGSFTEYLWLRGETAGSEAGELAQVQPGDTLP